MMGEGPQPEIRVSQDPDRDKPQLFKNGSNKIIFFKQQFRLLFDYFLLDLFNSDDQIHYFSSLNCFFVFENNFDASRSAQSPRATNQSLQTSRWRLWLN